MPRTYGPKTRAQAQKYKRAYQKARYSRYAKRLAGYRRGIKNYSTQIHNFKRTLNWNDEFVVESNIATHSSATESVVWSGGRMVLVNAAVGAGGTAYWSFSYKFNLANLLNLAEFTGLFDSYKINKVQCRIMPYATGMNGGSATVGVEGLSPILHYAIDHDDNTAPSADEVGIAKLHEYAGYKRKRILGNGVTITIYPRAQGVVFDDAALNDQVVASEMKRNTWYDCSATGVDHFGLKGVFEAVYPTANTREVHLRCETTYFLSFKSPR